MLRTASRALLQRVGRPCCTPAALPRGLTNLHPLVPTARVSGRAPLSSTSTASTDSPRRWGGLLWVGGFIAAVLGTGGGVLYLAAQLKRDREAVEGLPLLPGNPIVYLDIEDMGKPIGRLVFQLRKDVVPRSAENYRVLARGDLGYGYRTSAFHAIDKHARVFGGDFFGAGRSGYSIYGDTFEDENLTALRHMGPGTLSMVNIGPNTNNSQFFISLRRLPQYDGVYQVVGYMLEGWHVLDMMDKCALSNGRFHADHAFRVAACGELTSYTPRSSATDAAALHELATEFAAAVRTPSGKGSRSELQQFADLPRGAALPQDDGTVHALTQAFTSDAKAR